ncbi:DUF4320 family protein [Bacillus cereus]|uniref:DUF4320 family protein n=1 Tax=Bacillus cereus TaxID=1396 RepID=A0A9W7PYX5_BACCE|nr:DUF4320 family protein [Bacillus cereus]KAA6448213.1 DUF4320 family protein [Bacillus cereus]
MSETLAKGLTMLMWLFFILIIAEFIMYSAYYVKAQNTASSTLKIAERMGGFQYSYNQQKVDVEPYLKSQLNENHMYPDHWSYQFTKGKVEHNTPMEIAIKGSYEFQVFKLLPIDWGFDAKIPINVKRTGIGQVFFR